MGHAQTGMESGDRTTGGASNHFGFMRVCRVRQGMDRAHARARSVRWTTWFESYQT